MTKKQKKLIGIIFAIALCIGIIPAADAMHIMEGFIVYFGVYYHFLFLLWDLCRSRKKLQSIAELLFCLQFPAHSYL